MRRVKGKDTSPELRLRAAIRAVGLRGYRLHRSDLPGRPDVVFPRARVAVFVDGCFWHGCARCYRRPASSRAYWDAKLARNRARDRRAARALRAAGWRVLRFWEHAVRQAPDACARRIGVAVKLGHSAERTRTLAG